MQHVQDQVPAGWLMYGCISDWSNSAVIYSTIFVKLCLNTIAHLAVQVNMASETPVDESCDPTGNSSSSWMIVALVLMVTTASTSTACVALGCVAFHYRCVSKTQPSENSTNQRSECEQTIFALWCFNSLIRTQKCQGVELTMSVCSTAVCLFLCVMFAELGIYMQVPL